MGKYNEAYKDKDLPAIVFERDVDIVLPKLTNRDKRQIKEKTGVDLMQKFMETQSMGGTAQVDPAVEKIFEDVDSEIKDELNLPKIKAQLTSLIPEDEDAPTQKILSDVDLEVEHLLFKHSLEHEDSEIDDETIDRIIADLEMLEYIRALMWLVIGQDMNEEEAEEIAEEADSGNLNTALNTEK